ncbi:hypothetical protein AOLI_G00163150 [Acnodon oligacanthus]
MQLDVDVEQESVIFISQMGQKECPLLALSHFSHGGAWWRERNEMPSLSQKSSTLYVPGLWSSGVPLYPTQHRAPTPPPKSRKMSDGAGGSIISWRLSLWLKVSRPKYSFNLA